MYTLQKAKYRLEYYAWSGGRYVEDNQLENQELRGFERPDRAQGCQKNQHRFEAQASDRQARIAGRLETSVTSAHWHVRRLISG